MLFRFFGKVTENILNYIPILLTRLVCKLLENIIMSLTDEYLGNRNYLDRRQQRVRGNRSCFTSLLDFYESEHH